MTFRVWHFCGEKSKRKNMFIKVALCLLWYLFCACLLVDAVLLSVIYAAFSGVGDLLWALTLTRAGEGWATFNDWLTTIRLPTQWMTQFGHFLFIQSTQVCASCWDVNDAENLVRIGSLQTSYKEVLRPSGQHIQSVMQNIWNSYWNKSKTIHLDAV